MADVFVTPDVAAGASGFDAELDNLRRIFGALGDVAAARLTFSAALGRSGFLLTFASPAAARRALGLDGLVLKDRVLRVALPGATRLVPLDELAAGREAETGRRIDAAADGPAAADGEAEGEAGKDLTTLSSLSVEAAVSLLPSNAAVPDGLHFEPLLAEVLRRDHPRLLQRLRAVQAAAAAGAASLLAARGRWEELEAERSRRAAAAASGGLVAAGPGGLLGPIDATARRRLRRTLIVQGLPAGDPSAVVAAVMALARTAAARSAKEAQAAEEADATPVEPEEPPKAAAAKAGGIQVIKIGDRKPAASPPEPAAPAVRRRSPLRRHRGVVLAAEQLPPGAAATLAASASALAAPVRGDTVAVELADELAADCVVAALGPNGELDIPAGRRGGGALAVRISAALAAGLPRPVQPLDPAAVYGSAAHEVTGRVAAALQPPS